MKLIHFLVAMALCFSGMVSGYAVDAEKAEYRYVRIEQSSIGTNFRVKATIFADGHVFYEAQGNQVQVGLRHYRLDPRVFSQISMALDTSLLRTLDKQKVKGRECISHGTFVTIEDRSQEKTNRRKGWYPVKVVRNLGCKFEGKEEFRDMYRDVFDLLALHDLIGSEEERSRIGLCEIVQARSCWDLLRQRGKKAAPY